MRSTRAPDDDERRARRDAALVAVRDSRPPPVAMRPEELAPAGVAAQPVALASAFAQRADVSTPHDALAAPGHAPLASRLARVETAWADGRRARPALRDLLDVRVGACALCGEPSDDASCCARCVRGVSVTAPSGRVAVTRAPGLTRFVWARRKRERAVAYGAALLADAWIVAIAHGAGPLRAWLPLLLALPAAAAYAWAHKRVELVSGRGVVMRIEPWPWLHTAVARLLGRRATRLRLEIDGGALSVPIPFVHRVEVDDLVHDVNATYRDERAARGGYRG